MSDILELRQRVEAAEEKFGVFTAKQSKYSERLLTLVTSFEAAAQRAQKEHDDTKMALLASEAQNEQLRGLLHTLLVAVEQGGDEVGPVLKNMEATVAALSAATAEEAETAQPAEEAGPAVPEDAPEGVLAEAKDETAEAEDDAAPHEDGPDEDIVPEPPADAPLGVSDVEALLAEEVADDALEPGEATDTELLYEADGTDGPLDDIDIGFEDAIEPATEPDLVAPFEEDELDLLASEVAAGEGFDGEADGQMNGAAGPSLHSMAEDLRKKNEAVANG